MMELQFDSCHGLLSLPEEIVLQVSNHLSGWDIHHLCSVSTYLRNILDQNTVWSRLIDQECIIETSHIEMVTAAYISKYKLQDMNQTKLTYLMINRLNNNWRTGQSFKHELAQCCDRDQISLLNPTQYSVHVSQETLSMFCRTTNRLKVWDLCAAGGPSELTEITDKVLDLGSTSDAYVVLLDSFILELDSQPRTLELNMKVFTNVDFKLLWTKEKVIDISNLPRGRGNFATDLFTHNNFLLVYGFQSIILHEIKSNNLIVKILNLSIPEGIFQYPKFSAANEKYFGIPFQSTQVMLETQRPTICCWDLNSMEEKRLSLEEESSHGIFTDTRVRDDFFYGLHQWSGLIVWDIDQCLVLKIFSIDSNATWNPRGSDLFLINPFLDLDRRIESVEGIDSNRDIMERYKGKLFRRYYKTESQLIFEEKFGVNVFQFSI